MATQIIQLKDGMLIETDVTNQREVTRGGQQIAGGGVSKLGVSFDEQVKPLLRQICAPLVEVWNELNQNMCVEQAEVEVGLSFEGEGNLFVAKTSTAANFTVKLTLKPQKI